MVKSGHHKILTCLIYLEAITTVQIVNLDLPNWVKTVQQEHKAEFHHDLVKKHKRSWKRLLRELINLSIWRWSRMIGIRYSNKKKSTWKVRTHSEAAVKSLSSEVVLISRHQFKNRTIRKRAKSKATAVQDRRLTNFWRKSRARKKANWKL